MALFLILHTNINYKALNKDLSQSALDKFTSGNIPIKTFCMCQQNQMLKLRQAVSGFLDTCYFLNLVELYLSKCLSNKIGKTKNNELKTTQNNGK